MEAVEFLIENNYTFQRTFYIGFGHDEEVIIFVEYILFCMHSNNISIQWHWKVSGFEGAGHIAKHLKSTGVNHLDFVLDEGLFVLEDLVEGVDELVSVYE
jgi:carboxypeptidase PM20D1